MSPAPHEIQPTVNLTLAVLAAVPVIKTDRLTLRAPQISDFDALAEIFETRWPEEGDMQGREDAWYELTQMCATWVLRGHGWWAVDMDGLVGFTGIGFEPGDREHELGYMVTAEAEGKGIAFEAASAAKTWAQGKVPSLVSYIHLSNTRSKALAERLGAIRDRAAEATILAEDNDEIIVMRHWGSA